MSMDLGLDGRVALVMGASRGIGRGIAATLAREGARVAISSRSQEKLEEAVAEIDGDVAAFVADTSDLDRLAALADEVETSARPDRDPRRQHRRPPVRRRPRPRGRGVGAGLPLAGPRPGDPRQGRGPRDARAGLGADRQRRLDLDPRADPRPQPLQLPPDGGDRVPEDALARGRRRRDHRQHGPHRALRDRAPRRRGRLARGRRRGGPHPGARRRRLGTPEEYGDLVAFLCSERAAYITGTTIPIDGGVLRSSF